MLAVLGLLLWTVGWMANILAHPLFAGGEVPWALVALNALAGMAAGAAMSQLYAWFATGQADALMAARGGAAGLVARTITLTSNKRTGPSCVAQWATIAMTRLSSCSY